MAFIPALSIIIIFVRKLYPAVADYLAPAYVTLKEIDDLIEKVAGESPQNPNLQTVSDLLNKLVYELEQIGYTLEEKQLQKVENRLISALTQKEGWSINWEDRVGKIEFNKKF